jgi:hypothetical protein
MEMQRKAIICMKVEININDLRPSRSTKSTATPAKMKYETALQADSKRARELLSPTYVIMIVGV